MRSFFLCIAFIFLASAAFSRAVYTVDGNNVIIQLEGIGVKSKLLKVELWSQNTVRIRASMNENFSDEPTIFGVQTTTPIKFRTAYAQANIEIVAAGIQVNIAEDGIVRILSGTGRKLLVEAVRAFKPSEEKEGAYQITQKFFLNKNEHIYGFGQQDQQDRFLLRDKSFDIKQDASSIASPVLISEKGFALIWNNFSATHFEDNASGLGLTSAIADDIDYFIVNGPEWNTIISEIRNITGIAPLLPRWAYGFVLDPAAYSSESALKDAVNKYHDLDIPVETNGPNQTLYKEEKELTANKLSGRMLNAYAYSQLKPKYEAFLNSKDRTFITTHINLPGIQKYGTYTAAGEISQCWESLNCQVCAGIASSYSGQPYWSTAVGGMKVNPDCNAKSPEELNVRWNQFAAFTPIYMGSPIAYEAWKAGGTNDAKFQAIKKAIVLRYRLLPYIYTAAYQTYSQNSNIIRSLLFDYQKNESVHTNKHQYLFGQSLMICPVVEQTNELSISLPIENNWVDFWDGKTYSGGTDINVKVTLDHIPVFVKQGSIIPLANVGSNSLDSLSAPMEIRVYGGADAEFVLYEDENAGKGYLNGVSSKITFSYSEKSKTLSISAPEGEYPGMITSRVFNVALVSENNGIGEQIANTVEEVLYKGKKAKVKFK